MPFGGVFHDFLQGPWEEVRGFLQEELQQLRTSINAQWGAAFNQDGTLTTDTVGGDPTIKFQYVANTGPRNAPKWDKVNLDAGVTGRLAYKHLPSATASTLVGRGSTSNGDLEPIDLDASLVMTGTTLSVAAAATATSSIARTFLLMGA